MKNQNKCHIWVELEKSVMVQRIVIELNVLKMSFLVSTAEVIKLFHVSASPLCWAGCTNMLICIISDFELV